MRSIIPAPYLVLSRGPCPRRTIEVPEIRIPATASGHWTAQLISPAGVIRREWTFDNLIVDSGLDGLMTMANNAWFNGIFNRVAVGTGSIAPSPSDTGLQAEIARVTTTPSDVGSSWDATGFGFRRAQWEFDFGQANGNLTEVGVFTGAAGTMLSRALFTDSGGTPVTVTKTSADKLRLIYEIRIYPPASVDTVIPGVMIGGVSTTVTHRPAGKTGAFPSGWGPGLMQNGPFQLGAVGSTASGVRNSNVLIGYTTADNSGNAVVSTTWDAYAPGSFSRGFTLLVDTGGGNFGGGTPGIGGWWWSPGSDGASFDFSFAPQILKDDTKRATLDLTFSLVRRP